MTPFLLVLVLSAALLHAVWNSMVKSSNSPELVIASYQLIGSLICVVLAIFVPFPNPSAWPIIVGSVVIHNCYYFTLARAYRAGDLSQVYPIFRGMAPILVACGGFFFVNEYLALNKVVGISLISLAVVSLAFRPTKFGKLTPKALTWAIATAILIASYTIVDGLGVRITNNELSYIVWLFILEIVPIGIIILLTRRTEWFEYLRKNQKNVFVGGIASSLAYGLVVYAMSLGALAVVSSLRETSVIFASIIGAVVMREPFGFARARAAMLVAAGIVAMHWLSHGT